MIAAVPTDDRGLTLGVGLFETLLAVEGRLQLWTAHVARLHRGCVALGLPLPDEAVLRADAAAALRRSGLDRGRAAVRLSWTGGSGARGLLPPEAVAPRLFATATKAMEPPERLRLHTSAIRRSSTSPAARMKTLSYLDNVEARRAAVAAGAGEALLLNEQDHIACCAAANLFWVAAGRLCTPPLAAGVLDGVVRDCALALAREGDWPISETTGSPDCLRDAQGAFVTNSLIGAVEVVALDGVPLPPLDERTRGLLRAIGVAAGARDAGRPADLGGERG